MENKHVATYLTIKDFNKLKKRAKDNGFTVASFIRYLILKSFKEKI